MQRNLSIQTLTNKVYYREGSRRVHREHSKYFINYLILFIPLLSSVPAEIHGFECMSFTWEVISGKSSRPQCMKMAGAEDMWAEHG